MTVQNRKRVCTFLYSDQ